MHCSSDTTKKHGYYREKSEIIVITSASIELLLIIFAV